MPKVIPTYREDAKKRILQAAAEEFKDKGYFRTTINDIAKRLDISKATIYQYFDSKETLLKELYLGSPENLRQMFKASNTRDPISASKEVFNRMATKANATLFVDFLEESSTNPEFKKILRENIAKFTAALEDVLIENRQGESKEELKKIHNAVIMLGLIFNGLWCWLVVGVSLQEVQDTWATSVESILGPIVVKSN